MNRFGPEAKAVKKRPEALHQVGIALATLDGDPGVRAERHDFVASKAPWFEITDDLPSSQLTNHQSPKAKPSNAAGVARQGRLSGLRGWL